MVTDLFKKANLADWVGAITASLFVTGLCYQYGYYGTLGLNNAWIVNLLQAKEILIVNVTLIVTYLMATLYLESLFSKSTSNKKKVAILSNVVLTILMIINIIRSTWSGAAFYLIVIIALNSILLALSEHKTIKYTGLVSLILVVPYLNGAYEYHQKINTNSLSVAILKDTPNEKWYLLNTFSDKAILISDITSQKEIKVIEIKEIKSIKSEARF